MPQGRPLRTLVPRRADGATRDQEIDTEAQRRRRCAQQADRSTNYPQLVPQQHNSSTGECASLVARESPSTSMDPWICRAGNSEIPRLLDGSQRRRATFRAEIALFGRRQRQREEERRPLPQRTLRPDPAAMPTHQAIHDRESDAMALEVSRVQASEHVMPVAGSRSRSDSCGFRASRAAARSAAARTSAIHVPIPILSCVSNRDASRPPIDAASSTMRGQVVRSIPPALEAPM